MAKRKHKITVAPFTRGEGAVYFNNNLLYEGYVNSQLIRMICEKLGVIYDNIDVYQQHPNKLSELKALQKPYED